jgi:probable rRNA maturation factor
MTKIDIQIACTQFEIPSVSNLRKWAKFVLATEQASDKELSMRIVSSQEIQTLNATYRHKDKPTNVLSFPMDSPPGLDLPLLGDIILCAEVIQHEAQSQHKTLTAHFAHMVVHGILHLLGYDHIDDNDARIMETREIELLAKLGYPDPYGDDRTI